MPKIKLRRLLITLALGTIAISFIVGWWWVGTVFLLLTFLAACFAFPAKLYSILFSAYAIFAIAWVLSGLFSRVIIAPWESGDAWRQAMIAIASVVVSLVSTVVFWLLNLAICAKYMLKVSNGFHVSFGEAFKYLAAVTFGVTQPFMKVEDGKLAFENPRGMLSTFGGPGLLIVSPGNAAVLEWGGKISRIVGPGMHSLRRFEQFWKPVETKGIVDLRPQFSGGTAENVRTKDGVELDIEIGTFFQLEPTHVTDAKPGSRFAGGDATTEVIGGTEFPVYKAIIEKSLYKIPVGGWKTGWFPDDVMHRLRDVVATYTLDQIFSFDKYGETLTADQRVIKEIEDKIVEMFTPSAASGGVWFKGVDIRKIAMPPDVEEQVRAKWKARFERELRIARAETERDVLVLESEGRAQALERLEGVKLDARSRMAHMMSGLVDALTKIEKEPIALSFISIMHELTNRVGQDETVATRYIEAMQAVIQSDGAKSFVITPPTAAPGFMPSPPAPTLQSGQILEERFKRGEGEGKGKGEDKI
jgi:regulator of protease activity HflC (stomatin/prohibitin superfamily)